MPVNDQSGSGVYLPFSPATSKTPKKLRQLGRGPSLDSVNVTATDGFVELRLRRTGSADVSSHRR